jgi:hypothetical protein
LVDLIAARNAIIKTLDEEFYFIGAHEFSPKSLDPEIIGPDVMTEFEKSRPDRDIPISNAGFHLMK